MIRREQSFFSIISKSQIFIFVKLGGIWWNEVRFNELFTKTPKIFKYIQPFILK